MHFERLIYSKTGKKQVVSISIFKSREYIPYPHLVPTFIYEFQRRRLGYFRIKLFVVIIFFFFNVSEVIYLQALQIS